MNERGRDDRIKNMTGRVFSINIGSKKGEPKEMVASAVLEEGLGIKGDIHAGEGARQVSLLAIEEIEAIERSSLSSEVDFRPGIFAENITTSGIDLSGVKVGDMLEVGREVVLKVSQIGKECHSACVIMKKVGRCIMPKQGIFAVVEKGGPIKVSDRLVLKKHNSLLAWSKT